MMEKRIRLLRWAGRFGSLTKAARALGMAQSTLSREIALLEDQMQTPLLIRSGSGVTSTPAGTYLRSNSFGNLSQQILRECRRVAAGQLPGLVLECDMMSSMLAQPVLRRLSARAPEMPVQLYCYKAYSTLAHLLAGTANAAFMLTEQARIRQRLETLPLYREPWVVAARADHEYWSLSPADRGVLRGQTVLLDAQQQIRPEDLYSDPVSQYCSEYCLSNRDFLVGNFLPDLTMMLQAGLGVALVPPFAADSMPPEIKLSDELTTPFAPEFALVYRSDSHHPGVMLLRQLCLELFRGETHA